MEKIPILTNILKLGWNHQLETVSAFYIYAKMFFLGGIKLTSVTTFFWSVATFFTLQQQNVHFIKFKPPCCWGYHLRLFFFLIFEGFSELHFHFFLNLWIFGYIFSNFFREHFPFIGGNTCPFVCQGAAAAPRKEPQEAKEPKFLPRFSLPATR